MNQMTDHPPMPVHDPLMVGRLAGRCISVTAAASGIAQIAASLSAQASQPGLADAFEVSSCVSSMVLTADQGRSDH